MYPIHFLDENNNKYMKEYIQDGKTTKSACCMDCFQEAQQKKEDRKIEHTEHCHICESTYIAFGENAILKHINSTKHKKNQSKKNSIKTGSKVQFELLSVKELYKICSKSINEDGTYRINNYTKIKKAELVEKMNAIYDLLTLDFY